MTKPDRITTSMMITRNIGNYESIKIEVGLEASISPGETVEEAAFNLAKQVDELMHSAEASELTRLGRSKFVEMERM